MRFEKSVEIDAPQQRVWDVLSDLEAWPQRIETVDVVEVLTPPPFRKGSRVRLKQPKLPEGTWDVTTWDAPSYFEWTQKTGGTTSVAGHRVEALGEDRARLTLTLDMFNVMNSSTTLGRQYDATATGDTGFYNTLEIMNPRLIRLGVRFQF